MVGFGQQGKRDQANVNHMQDSPHILVVDDHRDIRDALARYLEKNGMRVTTAADARAMDAAMKTGNFDLLVLDVMMPGEDGLSVCRRLRADGALPILLLTALGEEMDRVVGLEMGADDYLAKPFSPRELLARVKAVLRRSQPARIEGGAIAGHRIAFDRWVLDTDRRVLVDELGAETALTTAEFRLMTAFLERPRFVLSRAQLLDLTGGRQSQVFDRAIDNQISRLRRKLEKDASRPELLTTVWGGGYSLSADVRELP